VYFDVDPIITIFLIFMKKHDLLLLCTFPLSFISQTSAQVTITYPSDRVIFQRDNSNHATITVAGYFDECMDQVEARLVPIKSHPDKPELGEPSPAGGGWTTIQITAACGNFYGYMTASGGWYQLQVRGIKAGKTTATGNVEHVGIGEVFLIAGQSNASGGDQNKSGPGAMEDAVSSVNFRVSFDNYETFRVPCPEYTHLSETTKTAPFGNYAWCWGQFADRLVDKLKVPVMIFNAGWSATGIENWRQSIPADGITCAWYGTPYPAGFPFGNLRIALNNYIAQSGIRAVLWHQGETDNFVQTSRSKYRSDLKAIIQETRDLSGKPDLAWVVARASRYTYTREGNAEPGSYTSDSITAAQNDLIGNNTTGYDQSYKIRHVFEGPATDDYWDSRYRNDQVHFAGDGLDSLAKFWVSKLTADFFAGSVPYAAIPPAQVVITPTDNDSYTFTPAAGWAEYNWLKQDNCTQTIAKTQQWTAGPGLYKLQTIDSNNNTVLSPAWYISASRSSLPVTWKYFKGKVRGNAEINLQWATTEENNAFSYEIERGKDALNFQKTGEVMAFGNTKDEQQYDYVDNTAVPGTYYYRIKQMDKNGKYDYSRIISVKMEDKEAISLFPNPVTDQLKIQSEKMIYSLEAFNSKGVKIHSSSVSGNSILFDMNGYPGGMYIFKVNGEPFKIVK
jgi:hypothetical protein